MGDFDNPKDIVNAREAFMPPVQPKREPVIDLAVSKIVGKDIKVNNPKLISIITKWKLAKGNDETQDNFLDDPKKQEELRRELG